LEAMPSGDAQHVPGNNRREWNVVLVHDLETINAAASFGDIIIFTGLFHIVQDENALAAVLGHEIAHVVARHDSEKLSQSKMFTGIGMFFDLVLDLGVLSGIITTLFLELPGSRNQETEADMIGIKLMAKACYDPRAAVDVQERMAQADSGSIEFLDTHPLSSKRVKHLESLLPEAYAIQAATACGGMYESMEGFKSAVGW